MLTLLFKEIKYFFITPIGYIVLGIYWSFNTLLFIVIENDFNLFQNQFLDFNIFFSISPWILIFLVPAIVMRSFSEEIQSGTIELIVSKPISLINIIWSKFIGCLFLFIISVFPSVFYIIYVSQFSILESQVDSQVIIGSYLGLLLLGSSFISICLPISIIFKNQISTFIIGSFLCFSLYYFFNQIALYSNSDFLYEFILNIGSHYHYINLISGVIPIRDVGYFIGLDIILIGISLYILNKSRHH